MTHWSPDVAAAVDQALAHADRELDKLLTAFRESAAADQGQALADLAVGLGLLSKTNLTGLLTVAVRRMAGDPPREGAAR